MARFRTMASFYADAPGVGRVRAGRTVADSPGAAVPGDVVWSGLNDVSLPAGFEGPDGLSRYHWKVRSPASDMSINCAMSKTLSIRQRM